MKARNSTLERSKIYINVHKLGGTYRILGVELLRAISPDVERKAWRVYDTLKMKTKRKIQDW